MVELPELLPPIEPLLLGVEVLGEVVEELPLMPEELPLAPVAPAPEALKYASHSERDT